MFVCFYTLFLNDICLFHFQKKCKGELLCRGTPELKEKKILATQRMFVSMLVKNERNTNI